MKKEQTDDKLQSAHRISQHNTYVNWCIAGTILGVLYLGGAIGLIVWGFDEKRSTSWGYVCGSPPTPEDVLNNTLPVCIEVKMDHSESFPPRPQRPLCLQGGRKNNDPPVWCYRNVEGTNFDYDVGDDNYWLYWSSWQDCGGTAWRMYNERDQDNSWFKTFSEPTRMPPTGQDAGWLRWSSFGETGNWVDVVVDTVECDDKNASATSSLRGSNVYSLPVQCFGEIVPNRPFAGIIAGSILLALPFVILLCVMAGMSEGQGSHGHYYGGYSAGGGGGGGDGGGGC